MRMHGGITVCLLLASQLAADEAKDYQTLLQGTWKLETHISDGKQVQNSFGGNVEQHLMFKGDNVHAKTLLGKGVTFAKIGRFQVSKSGSQTTFTLPFKNSHSGTRAFTLDGELLTVWGYLDKDGYGSVENGPGTFVMTYKRVAGAEPPEPPTGRELIKGRWKVVSEEHEGLAECFLESVLTFLDAKGTIEGPGSDGQPNQRHFCYFIRPGATTKGLLDMTLLQPVNEKRRCVYEFTGDELRLFMELPAAKPKKKTLITLSLKRITEAGK